jgi:putative oxidoreductase
MRTILLSIGLLLLRVAASAMMFVGHGLGKAQNFSEYSKGFPDPLNVGSQTSLILAILGEVVCPCAIALGLCTRLAAIGAAGTMVVAAFVVHADDPWFVSPQSAKAKEMALLYLIPFAALVFTGPGKFSLDGLLFRAKAPKVPAA